MTRCRKIKLNPFRKKIAYRRKNMSRKLAFCCGVLALTLIGSAAFA